MSNKEVFRLKNTPEDNLSVEFYNDLSQFDNLEPDLSNFADLFANGLESNKVHYLYDGIVPNCHILPTAITNLHKRCPHLTKVRISYL